MGNFLVCSSGNHVQYSTVFSYVIFPGFRDNTFNYSELLCLVSSIINKVSSYELNLNVDG